jgi:3-phenylpropionate/trans-cinnamate dioxygenase ferredoxin reductase subunit
MRTIAIVGSSLAGLSAARALRAQSYNGRIVLIGDERHRPYDRPPLSKEFLTGTVSHDDLALEAEDDAELELDWRLGERALRLDAKGRSVELVDGSEVRADGVVIATGARARRLPDTDGLAGVHVLRTLDDAVALRAALRPGARIVVIGAGFIGSEVASTAHGLGCDVTVVEAQPVPLAGPLGADMGQVCAGLHGDHGVRLLSGVGVADVVGSRHVQAVRLADGRELPADAVVVGIGALPNVEWLAGSGLEILGGIVTDAGCATNIPGVVAVGDCAATYNVHAEGILRVEHWTNALEQPTTAAATLLSDGLSRRPHTAVPYFWSEQYGVRIQFAGHRREGDAVRVIDGDPDARSFLAVYERAGDPVAVLGMNQPKLFTRWRRQLEAPARIPAAV